MTRNFISIESIIVAPDRQRRTFRLEEIQELSDSISRIGLLHPIVLRVAGDSYQLVAGERRLRAIQDLHVLGQKFNFCGEPVIEGMIPFLSLGDLSPIEAMEAELEENIRRSDLTWQEKSAASSALMELRTAQAIQAGLPAPTIPEISREIRGSSEGSYGDATRKEIILAKHLSNPLIQKAKSADEAFSILKKEEKRQKNETLGKSIGDLYTASDFTLRNTDCFSWMAAIPNDQFEVILTDPPYGMGADAFNGFGKGVESHSYADGKDILEAILEKFPSEAFRLTKPQAHAYIFCDFDGFLPWKAAMEEAGWQVFRTPLIWYKPDGYQAPWIEKGPQRQYETILFASKGGKKVNQMRGDVIQCPRDSAFDRPASKPSALFRELLLRSASPGDHILDPFCGTGPIFQAAFDAKCFATGLEIDPAAYAIAAKRIEGIL